MSVYLTPRSQKFVLIKIIIQSSNKKKAKFLKPLTVKSLEGFIEYVTVSITLNFFF